MSQATTWNVPLVGPGTMSAFAGRAGPSFDALLTMHSGASRPAYATAHTHWLKIVSGTQWELYLYDGSDDILVGTYNPGADTFTLNSDGLGFATSLVARTDATPLSLINGRVVITQGASGQAQLELKGKSSGDGDQSYIRFSNGVSDAQRFKIIDSNADSGIKLVDASDADLLIFDDAGDITSSDWGALSEQIVQPGTVLFGPWTSTPPGLLTLDGSLVSRTTFARLWTFVSTYCRLVSEASWSFGAYGAFSTGDGSTTFRLPSWGGGYFPRLVANDTPYFIGTFVADAFAQHTHAVTDPTHTHNAGAYLAQGAATHGDGYSGGTNRAFLHTTVAAAAQSTGISIQNNGGSETMPNNIPMRACIKY